MWCLGVCDMAWNAVLCVCVRVLLCEADLGVSIVYAVVMAARRLWSPLPPCQQRPEQIDDRALLEALIQHVPPTLWEEGRRYEPL